MADVNLKFEIETAKAQAQLAKLNAALSITAEKEQQAALKTKILEERLKKMAGAGDNAKKGFTVANIALSSFIGNITSRAVSTAITSVINGVRGLVDAGRDFEAGLVQVAKTTGLGESAVAAFGQEIEAIGQRIPVATENLLEIATVAGQLGIKGTENLTAFTETIAKLQLATDIAGQEGSQSVARILTITGELEENGSENINKFGSVITELGNNFAATENQILQVANEVAKGTTVFNVSSEDVLGLATAFKVTGSEAEISGSTIQEVFKKIGDATTEGGQSLTRFAEAANMSEEAFVKLFQTDPTQAFIALAEGLGSAGLTGEQLNKKLEDLDLKNKRVIKSLGPLITRYQTLKDAVGQAREESERKTALDIETAKAQNTLNADLQKLSNSFDKFGNKLFETVGPALRAVVQGLISMFNVISENTELFVALTALIVGSGIALTVVAVKAAVAAGAFTATAAAASAMWIAITGPVGLAVAGIVALTAVLYSATDGFSNAKKEAEQYKKNLEELDAGYKDADEDGQKFLSTVSEITGGMEEAIIPLARAKKEFEELPAPMGKVGLIAEEVAEKVVNSARKILLFEQDKTAELKKFFKEEEIAKLESNFKILESEKEKLAFTRFVTNEGKRRQEEAFKATIGLDKATLEAKRKALQEQKRLLEEEKQKEEELFEARRNLKIAEREFDLLTSGERQLLRETELQDVVNFLDRESQARAQARLDNIEDEKLRQTAITEIRQEALEQRKDRLAKAEAEITKIIEQEAEKRKKFEKLKNQVLLSGTASLFGSLADITRNGSRRAFEASKAFAIAETVIKGIVATQQALATPPGPPYTIPLAAAQAVAAASRVITIKGTSPSFETGGIVPGTQFTGDNVNARVNSGEMILTRQQQNQLFKLANGQTADNQQKEIVVHTRVDLDGEQVGYAVSRQVANGLVLGEVQ